MNKEEKQQHDQVILNLIASALDARAAAIQAMAVTCGNDSVLRNEVYATARELNADVLRILHGQFEV